MQDYPEEVIPILTSIRIEIENQLKQRLAWEVIHSLFCPKNKWKTGILDRERFYRESDGKYIYALLDKQNNILIIQFLRGFSQSSSKILYSISIKSTNIVCGDPQVLSFVVRQCFLYVNDLQLLEIPHRVKEYNSIEIEDFISP